MANQESRAAYTTACGSQSMANHAKRTVYAGTGGLQAIANWQGEIAVAATGGPLSNAESVHNQLPTQQQEDHGVYQSKLNLHLRRDWPRERILLLRKNASELADTPNWRRDIQAYWLWWTVCTQGFSSIPSPQGKTTIEFLLTIRKFSQ